MKYAYAVIGLTFLALTITNASHGRDFPKLKGPYLGQPVPGMKAEVFAPGAISADGWELEGVFAPGMQEFYFTTRGGKYTAPTVIGFRQENSIWKKYIEFTRDGEVTFSPDGNRMHMAEGYKERIGSDWSERAMVYFDPATRDGVILFINGPASTSVDALVEGLRLLDPGSRMAALYEGWMARYRARQAGHAQE